MKWNRMRAPVDEMKWLIVIAVPLSMNAATVRAQDTRQVTEPKVPASCTQLPAQIRAMGDKLAEADESKLDTARIQSALDKCRPGMAVELKPASGNNAFLSGPLEMRTGVTLLIDEGVTLFGSRDPAVYESTAPRCGAGTVRHDCSGRAARGISCATASGAGPRRMQTVHQY
jgi:polygalacturonase